MTTSKTTIKERFMLNTEKNSDGYICKCTYGDKVLKSAPNPLVTMGINVIINSIVSRQKEKGLERDVDYIFKIPLK